MDEAIRAELQRLHDEEERQNNRLKELEMGIREIRDISISVGKLAVSVEAIAREVHKQGERLESIEKKPLTTYDAYKTAAVTALIGLIVGYMVNFILR